MEQISEEERLELLDQVREQNMSISVFCGDNGLKSKFFKKMLYGHIPFTYKVYALLQNRLLEEEEWVDFIKNHPTGLNEDNHFYEDSLVV